MFYKRPSLRRGGKPEEPTGIEQLTPRKNFQFGTPGFNFLEPGLQRELRSSYLNQPGNRIGFTPSAGIKNPFLRGGMMTAPFAGVGALAYLNRPKTTEALKVMKSEPSSTFDETGAFDFEDYSKRLSEADKKGEKISFLDALFMDPETGTYPSIFGRTEDRDKKLALEKEKQIKEENKFLKPGFTEDTSFDEGNSLSSAIEKVVPNKNIKSKDTGPGGQTVEDSFESTYDNQMKRLEKYLGTSNRESKGKLALALSDAIGTPGSIADKAAVLNKSLLNIAAGRKKDKREMAKLAFAAATELEKAEIAAGKKSQTEKLIERAQRLEAKDKLTTAEATELRLTKAALGDRKKQANLDQVIRAGQEVRDNIDKYKDQLKIVERSKGEAKTQAESDLAGYKRDILSDIQIMKDLGGVENSTLQTLFGEDLKLFLADGGRVNKAMGGPSETPAEPVATDLSFEQLRTRLPKEITDDIVKLVATSEEALQDFAYIRTQGDVEKFNVKYGVNLVLPQDTA